jgi:hypothetical protein
MRDASKTFVVIKRILFALPALITAVTFCPKPADARVVVVFNRRGYTLLVIIGAQMVTCTMRTRIGIAVFGGTVTGSIGRPVAHP